MARRLYLFDMPKKSTLKFLTKEDFARLDISDLSFEVNIHKHCNDPGSCGVCPLYEEICKEILKERWTDDFKDFDEVTEIIKDKKIFSRFLSFNYCKKSKILQ